MADTGVVREVISDGYREMQESLHEDPDYGASQTQLIPIIAEVITEVGAHECLDYGCGKGALAKSIGEYLSEPITVHEYDPARPGKSESPEPCEFVVCVEVLEHVEPDLIDNVLDDIHRVMGGFGFLSICTAPAVKLLSDGRNAHLIIESMEWWMPKLLERFQINSLGPMTNGFWLTCRGKNGD